MIKHYCNTDIGSSGGPIFNSKTVKVFGIHFGSKNDCYNYGTDLEGPVNEFQKIYKIEESKIQMINNGNEINKSNVIENGQIKNDNERDVNKITVEENKNNKESLRSTEKIERNDNKLKLEREKSEDNGKDPRINKKTTNNSFNKRDSKKRLSKEVNNEVACCFIF